MGPGISGEPPSAPIQKPTTGLIAVSAGAPVFNLVSSPYCDITLVQIEGRGYKSCVCPTREITPLNLGRTGDYLRGLRYVRAVVAGVVSLLGCCFGCLLLVWRSLCLFGGCFVVGGRVVLFVLDPRGSC